MATRAAMAKTTRKTPITLTAFGANPTYQTVNPFSAIQGVRSAVGDAAKDVKFAANAQKTPTRNAPTPTTPPGTLDPAFDMNSPGWGEQWWASNQGFAGKDNLAEAAGKYDSIFSNPSASEQYWGQVSGNNGPTYSEQYWNQVNGTPATNRSAQEYDSFDAFMPSFDAYYDNAFRRGSDKLNANLAARGQYGSSQGVQQINDFTSSMEAERANREADFMAQQRRDRAAIAGQADNVDIQNLTSRGALANSASSSALSNLLGRGQLANNATNAALSRAEGGLGLGKMLDQQELQDFTTGMTAATTAQGLREGRLRGGYDDLLKIGDRTSPIVNGGFDQIFGTDERMFENYLQTVLGIPREQINQLLMDRSNNAQSAQFIMDMIGTFYGGGGMGGGGGGGGFGANGMGGGSYTPAGQYGQNYGGGITPEMLGQ